MNRTFLKRALLLFVCMLFVCSIMTLGVSAAESEQEALGSIFSAQRIEYAISVTIQGMLMVFAVLALLWGVVAIFKVVLHDIPEKRAAKKQALSAAVAEAAAPQEQPAAVAPAPEEDEGEIVAAITAAIAATLASEEYKDQFASGFRVVSFKRKGGAWNKEN